MTDTNKYKIELSIEEIKLLQNIISNNIFLSVLPDSLKEKIKNPVVIKKSKKKEKAAHKATEKRTQKAKNKIENAINLLKFEGKKITYYSISKTGNVSYNTVIKYISKDHLVQLNN